MERPVTLHLRTQVEPFKGSGDWEPVTLRREVPARETAIVVCDMWDRHWCRGAMRRGEAIARKMDRVLAAARERGAFIIHAPSECMKFYRDAPERQRMQRLPAAA